MSDGIIFWIIFYGLITWLIISTIIYLWQELLLQKWYWFIRNELNNKAKSLEKEEEKEDEKREEGYIYIKGAKAKIKFLEEPEELAVVLLALTAYQRSNGRRSAIAEKHIASLDGIFEEKFNLGYKAVKKEFLDKVLGVVGKDILYRLKNSSIAIMTLYLLEAEYTQEFPSSPVWIEEEFKTKQFKKAFADAKIKIKEPIVESESEKDKALEVLEKIQAMQREMNKMYKEVKEMYMGKERDNKKKEKMGIFDIIHPLTEKEYKRLPLTFRDLFEKFWANKIYKLPRKIRSEEIKVYFLETLKRFKRYAPSYTEKNKQDISDVLIRMLESENLQEEKEIIDIVEECKELVETEKKSQ